MGLPSETQMELYCSNKKALIRTMCRTNQWSGVTEGEINDWIFNNFKDVKGKYLAIKILLHSLYYSESNLIQLLKTGIYSRIFGDKLKAKLIEQKNVYGVKSEMNSFIKSEIKNTLFIPLLDSDSPSESGNAMIRYLTHKLEIESANTSFHFSVRVTDLEKYRTIVIVDDCLGSGHQIYDFWNNNISFRAVKEAAIAKGIEIYYLILVGNEDALLTLQLDGDLVGLKVRICERLGDHNRVFQVNNTIWNGDEAELNDAIAYFDTVEATFQVPRLGYNDMDFAVFIHNTTPDWSLPIFWKKNSDWRPLFKRKNSGSI
jgi:hypothetical protein